MASFSSCSSLPLVILFLGLLSFAQVTLAGRSVPANSDKKETTECVGQEGTVVIPGVGRYKIGSHEMPAFRGLDHSGPAAANGQYLPGNDDTFVPNPGFEVPNPFRVVIP
ncbi:hypothetical protein C4D60_Mb05t10400 [Musa balbisiana]|uniref:Cell wall protein n=1 Tax=Musa balbisiana TaxID=52838 RepID=A0A4S8JV33_MUSBA|nr:hypothetical protein C4D60_Mb05t10400 [Musa balbisiana]